MKENYRYLWKYDKQLRKNAQQLFNLHVIFLEFYHIRDTASDKSCFQGALHFIFRIR